jgi:CRP-like cAMP-binding protein
MSMAEKVLVPEFNFIQMASHHPTSCITCENNNCFIKECSKEWMDWLGTRKTESFYKKGQYVITKGHPIFGLYFIRQGKVKVISSDWKGKEQIVRLASDGHILGHRGYGGESYPIGAVAMDDSTICFIENELLYQSFLNNPAFTYKLMMFYSQELRGLEKRMKFMAQMTVLEKIVSSLWYLKEIFGYTKDEKVLNVNISRTEIAALAGTSQEQVVRALTELENEKVISKVVRKIKILDERKLEKIIEAYK